MQAKSEIEVALVRSRPTAPHVEPMSIGIPFGRGALRTCETLAVADADGAPVPFQAMPLAHWPDGSVRWALVDVVLPAVPQPITALRVRTGATPLRAAAEIACTTRPGVFEIDTGAARFQIPRDVFAPFSALSLRTAPSEMHGRVTLEDHCGRALQPRLDHLAVEVAGGVRVTLAGGGDFRGDRGTALCRFAVRVSFHLDTALVRLDFTLHNPRRARHRGGVWDLGDPGSILFRALTLEVQRAAAGPHQLFWRAAPPLEEQRAASGHVDIYQASSGGEQWESRNHIDRGGRVGLPFRGARITDGARGEAIDRASPVVALCAGGVRLSAASTQFWQQFPSAIGGGPDGLHIDLFPRRSAPFELQGGEQTTHTVYLYCAPDGDGGEATADLAWVHDPLVPCLAPDDVAASGAFAHFVAARDDPHRDYVDFVQQAIEGPHSFFRKREVIDEYGWRHFGEAYADHEDLHFAGPHPVVSHYNNQYDLVYGFLLHFARTADPRWFELAADLACHVIDIDLYHTAADKPAYSGGMFWHTDHYQDAGRATHRSYSGDSPRARGGASYGGGPSNEHCYTSGLLAFHYLTGDPAARAAVLQLADWVVRMDDGALSLLGYLASGPTGLASATRDRDYHGPGRGAGNAINALLDAFRLSGERHYLTKAEELIARCAHPRDDPARHRLDEAETRWSYTVFLQSLGKYLDLKCERGEHDRAFAYARATLTRYAEWMLAHEAPFLSRPERLEYPTESWPAQDLRKSCVFDYAAQYGPPALRARLEERAAHFFDAAMRGVRGFDTQATARPLAVLLANGVQRASACVHPPAPVPPCDPGLDFGAPVPFLAQRDRARHQLRTLSGWLRLARAALRPAVLRRVLAGQIW